MEDKFEKKTVCEYCGGTMDAKYRSKRFCSGKCRTYWNRENKVNISDVKIDLSEVKTFPQPDVKIKKEEVLKSSDQETKHSLWQEGDPKEGSMAFFNKYLVETYDQLAIKTGKK